MRVRIDAFPNPHPALRATLSRRARDKPLQDRVTSKSDKTPANERNSHKKAQKAHKEPLPYVLFMPFCGYFPLRVSDFAFRCVHGKNLNKKLARHVLRLLTSRSAGIMIRAI